jgi:hypothetical protein
MINEGEYNLTNCVDEVLKGRDQFDQIYESIKNSNVNDFNFSRIISIKDDRLVDTIKLLSDNGPTYRSIACVEWFSELENLALKSIYLASSALSDDEQVRESAYAKILLMSNFKAQTTAFDRILSSSDNFDRLEYLMDEVLSRWQTYSDVRTQKEVLKYFGVSPFEKIAQKAVQECGFLDDGKQQQLALSYIALYAHDSVKNNALSSLKKFGLSPLGKNELGYVDDPSYFEFSKWVVSSEQNMKTNIEQEIKDLFSKFKEVKSK